jgi:hypothetical protein
MAITTNYGKLVVDTSLIPYMRYNNVEFTAHNLMPYTLSKLFFDDVAVNNFCQAGGRLLLDSKKVIAISRNNSTAIATSANDAQTDIVFQGTSSTVNTFNGRIEAFFSSNSTIVIRRLSGDFDETSQLFIQNVSTGQVYANCNVISVTNFQTSDSFYPGEGIIAPQRGNAYATVIATSGENILYVNQNYINLNVDAVGVNILASMGSDYKNGDIIYQTASGVNRYDLATFKGVVRYFNVSGAGSIAIEPLEGNIVANSNVAGSNVLVQMWNASNPAAKPLAANDFNTLGIASNNFIRSVTNTSVNINVSSFIHRSGVIANTLSPNTSTITLVTSSGNNPANGNLVYFTTGTGVGEIRRVVSISGAQAVLNSSLSFAPTSNTHYSIGNFEVDQYGTLAGIFHIPAYPTFKFKTGNRVFTITDTARYNDPEYKMRASATYAASGLLNQTQRIQTTPVLPPLPETYADIPVTPIAPADRTFNGTATKSPVTGSTSSSTPRIPLGDGLAQTFFTPKPNGNQQDYGIFCSSIDLFFKSKPSVAQYFQNSKLISRGSLQLPVTVKIAEVQNGYPTKNYLAAKTLQAKDVKISEIPSTSNTATVTKFTFDDPVYLEPNREYAIVIGSDSPDYEVWIAELGTDVLGITPTRRISEQPYAGSFFRSQNSSTWTPYQNQDLMFVLNKAVFNTAGTATFNLEDTPTANTLVDRVMLMSSDLRFPVGIVDYNLRGKYAIDGTSEVAGVFLTPHVAVEYGTLLDRSGKESSTTFLNRRVLERGNANSFLMTVQMSSSNPDVSPIVNTERLSVAAVTYGINNAGITNTDISITNIGSAYTNTGPENTSSVFMSGNSFNVIVGGANSTINNFAQLYRETFYPYPAFNVGFYNVTITNNPNDRGGGATGFAVANTDGSNTINHIVITTVGKGYLETPSIVIANGAGGSATQASALVSGETGKNGGNILSKYITREIVLADGFESGDIRVFMDAILPTACGIEVYYKVLSSDDPQRISDKSWRRMAKVKEVYSRNAQTLVGLEFRPSLSENRINYTENGVSYPIGGSFKNFQIKVCLTSSDASIVPKVRNLRIIAVPEG